MRKKTMYLVEALDKDKIARVYGFSEYEEDARLECIIALTDRDWETLFFFSLLFSLSIIFNF